VCAPVCQIVWGRKARSPPRENCGALVICIINVFRVLPLAPHHPGSPYGHTLPPRPHPSPHGLIVIIIIVMPQVCVLQKKLPQQNSKQISNFFQNFQSFSTTSPVSTTTKCHSSEPLQPASARPPSADSAPR